MVVVIELSNISSFSCDEAVACYTNGFPCPRKMTLRVTSIVEVEMETGPIFERRPTVRPDVVLSTGLNRRDAYAWIFGVHVVATYLPSATLAIS